MSTAAKPATGQARPVSDLLARLDDPAGQSVGRPVQVFPTGFVPLDGVLDGGLRSHDLTLLAGKPGVGKTVAMLQWARNMAFEGKTALFVCYEHNEWDLLIRLLCCEMGTAARPESAPVIDKLRQLARDVITGQRALAEALVSQPLLAAAYERVNEYARRLVLVRGSSARTDVAELERLAAEHGNGDTIVFVDYLQKVAAPRGTRDETDKTLRVAESLEDLALNSDLSVVATVAVDRPGLAARRLHLQHLRGSSALSYEADVVITMNEKWECISNIHFAYDPSRAVDYRTQTVFSLDKNRSGPALVNMEFTKDFTSYRFDNRGAYVSERLIDDRVYTE